MGEDVKRIADADIPSIFQLFKRLVYAQLIPVAIILSCTRWLVRPNLYLPYSLHIFLGGRQYNPSAYCTDSVILAVINLKKFVASGFQFNEQGKKWVYDDFRNKSNNDRYLKMINMNIGYKNTYKHSVPVSFVSQAAMPQSCVWNRLSRAMGIPVHRAYSNWVVMFQLRLYSTELHNGRDTKDGKKNVGDQPNEVREEGSEELERDHDSSYSEAHASYYDNYMKIFGRYAEFATSDTVPITSNIKQVQSLDGESEDKMGPSLTHTDQRGRAKMVDVGDKRETRRRAVATGVVFLGAEAFKLVQENRHKKGDVLTVAQVAGILAAKNTSSLIPLCHNLMLNKVDIDLVLEASTGSILITCEAHTNSKTGVEMEAMVGVSIAALTIYDMCKAVTHDITITDIRLMEKEGGRSGHYQRS